MRSSHVTRCFTQVQARQKKANRIVQTRKMPTFERLTFGGVNRQGVLEETYNIGFFVRLYMWTAVPALECEKAYLLKPHTKS